MSARIYDIPGDPLKLFYAAFDLLLDGTERNSTPRVVIPRGAAVQVLREHFIDQDMIDVDIVYANALYTVAAPFLSQRSLS